MSRFPIKKLHQTRLIVPVLIGLFYFLPILVSTYQLFSTVNKDRDFAQKEIFGTFYLEKAGGLLFHVFWALIEPSIEQKKWEEEFKGKLEELEMVHLRYAEAIGSDRNSLYVRGKEHLTFESLKAIGGVPNLLSDNSRLPQIAEKLLGMIAHVGDTSNLILDPDLDSYYMMDIVLLTIPKFLHNILDIHFGHSSESSKLDFHDPANRMVLSNLLRFDTLEGIKDKVSSSLREDPNFYGTSPTLAGRISTPYQNLIAQLTLFSEDLAEPQEKLSLTRLHHNHQSVLQLTKEFWVASLYELRTLLQIRLDTIVSNKIRSIVFSTCTWGICLALTLFLVGSMRRIQSQLESALTQIQQDSLRRELTLQGALDGIVQTDQYGKILEINPAAEQIFGYKLSEVKGRGFLEVFLTQEFHKVQIGGLLETHKHSPSDLMRRRLRVRGLKKSGQEMPLELSLLVVHFADRPMEFTAFVRDLSQEEKLVNESKMQQSKLIVASRLSSLGEVAGGIAHEIKNPLAIIDGNLQKLKVSLEEFPNGKNLEKSIETMRKSVSRITKIIDGLRTFARSGEGDPFDKVNLKNIIDEASEFCRARIESAGVELRVYTRSPGQVEARSVQISQVLINLLSNSLDAVSGTVSPWIEMDLVEYDDHCQIVVTDSGKGIPPDVVEKIMQPFFTTKPIGKGTGLGLSISLGIVQDHGGEFFLDSSFPHTRFVIKLPRHQQSLRNAA